MLRTNGKILNGKTPSNVVAKPSGVKKKIVKIKSSSAPKPVESALTGNYGRVLFQMAICIAGIYVCFGFWSIKQERIMTKPYDAVVVVGGNTTVVSTKLSTVFVLGLVQVVMAVVVSCVLLLAERLYAGKSQKAEKEETQKPKLEKKKKGTVKPKNGEMVNRREDKKVVVGRTASNKPKRKTEEDSTALSTGADKELEANKAFRNAVLIGFTNGFASMLGFAAMRRLPYPVVLATKMSKMVPVILVGFFWHGTRYSLSKCLACALITGGSFCFYMLGEAGDESQALKSKTRNRSEVVSLFGFVLLFVNLLADGFTNSTQDKLVKVHGWTSNKLMFVTNLSTALWIGAVLLLMECLQPFATAYLSISEPVTFSPSFAAFHPLLHRLDESFRWFLRDVAPFNDFSKTMDFFNRHPEALYDVTVMSVLNAVGQMFIFRTISLFGSLTLTALTLLRKSSSVVLSIIVHGHSVTLEQWFSLAVVFAGAVWEGLIHARKEPVSSK
ncbi:hypothetical protein, conserved [Trypanosoma brucei gambiense DAL972]|uniref:UDP-galactose transporter n=2 Tax=Trypanosoma brucei TaxID=5691 RepID=C9ZSL0_TRYB9|nr:hypothetical protein, conserved [Trypanosoma brucei gambiense DAL972]RHW71158.1 UAA transporter family [Trypanosoma brucei equiperdum]CBH12394.1 hypothetical protein, conserved [Trypanosoma brucei gambiense DAL972]|eukprot:XP_011774675.1 hypothetical protein, conserved [Trypanosoma brucei gambiense DAL972]